MKEFMKRAAAIAAAALMVFSISATSFAEPTSRPRPGSAAATETVDNSNNESRAESGNNERASATKIPVVTEAPSAPVNNKSYTTKGGSFLWFLLSVIVNAAISFAAANRVYKLTRKSNHVQSELRALRRDLEEKFAGSVGGFVESDVDITNVNDDYSMGEDGIKMTPASTVSVDDDQEEVYKQWEAQFGAKYASRKNEATAEDEAAPEEEYEEEQPVREYKPQRASAEAAHAAIRERIAARRAKRNEASDEDEDSEGRSAISERLSGIGNKAKKLLGGIFPFDEEDEE